MKTLAAGAPAANFTLKTVNGAEFSLKEALSRGPVLAAFFKVSCPVCQFSFPYVERIYKANGGNGVSIIGVSQNDAKDTAAFMKQFGITFPVLLDDPKSYPVSNAYGLTNVPTLFWIAADGNIEVSSVGWMRSEVEEMNRLAAAANKVPVTKIILPNEKVPEMRAG